MKWGALYGDEKLLVIGAGLVILAGVGAAAFVVSKFFLR